jgi:tetratricopeptide (TPR) repeat protein
MRAVVGLLLYFALLAACERGRAPFRSEGETGATASAKVVRPPVVVPDLTQMAESVREQVRESYSALEAARQRPSATRAEIAPAYGRLGALLLAADYLDAAEAVYLNAQTLDPGEFRWPYLLGHVHRRQGQTEKAAASFEQALRIQPDDVPALVWLGEVRLSEGRPDAAESHFSRALSLQPGSAPALFGLGRAALARQDPAQAVGYFEKALAADRQASAIHYVLAIAYRAIGDSSKADAHLRQRGDTPPVMPDPLMQEIAGLLESAIRFDSLSRQALAGGDWQAAIRFARRGLAVVGTNATLEASLHHRLGTALVQTGDARGAYEEFERSVKAVPDFAPGLYSLGVMLLSIGEFSDAVEPLSAAVRARPTYVEAWLGLAEALQRAGRGGEARARLIEGSKLNPGAAALTDALKRMNP